MQRATLFFIGVLLGLASISGDVAVEDKVPLFEGLGGFGRRVTTESAEAQRYFDQGLCFLYAFNHDEAIRSFREAGRLDPECAMAWWGVAVANGPHINRPTVDGGRVEAAWEALGKAKETLQGESEIEVALITALEARYANPQPEDRKPLDEAYAVAMKEVWEKYPNDADVGGLYAEALMDLRPWDLWTQAGEAQPGTDLVLATLEKVLEINPQHPLALHLTIHAIEASPNPERADAAADRLRDLQPGLGHMVHMPSHIDVRRGRWKEAIVANEKAIEADRLYRMKSEKQDFYRIYMAHNLHMLAYAAAMRGQSRLAIEMIDTMIGSMPVEWVKENVAIADGFQAAPIEFRVRFGKWEEILAVPEPAEYLPITRALWHQARGVAYAARKQVPEAKLEQGEFLKWKAKVPAEGVVGNSPAVDVLGVAEHLLNAEILYREGKVEESISEFREAIRNEDGLRYDEPPDWIHPVRHALGATLLQERRAAEAETVYRDDLEKYPENGWGLFGLAQALRMQGMTDEADEVEERFRKTWGEGDVELKSSCFCQPGK